MVESLLHSTSGILHRSGGKARGRSLFARDTRAAIEQGARYAVAPRSIAPWRKRVALSVPLRSCS